MNKKNICHLCKKKASPSFYKMSSYWFCDSCGLAWKKSFPKASYDETYYKGKSSLASKIFQPVANFFYSIRQGYADNTITKKVWVDVGAGEGGFIKTVHAKKRIGVEVSASGRKMMQENGIHTLTDKQFLKTKNMKADIISFWHVLEHVEKPWEYLLAGKINLSKKGKIVIGIPNIDSFDFKFSKKYWFHLQPQFHLWHFSTNSIKKLLEQVGFLVEKIDYWSPEHHLTGVLQSIINKASGSSENVLHKLIKRGTGGKVRLRDVFWSILWLTIGFPIVFLFWVAGSVFRKSGTMVIVVSIQNQKTK